MSYLNSRRRILQAGVLGILGGGGLLQTRLQADSRDKNPGGRSCVFIFLFGGPSHIDLWDMKPAAPREVRGEFSPTATSVPGIRICEHLPQLARCMERFSLIRSMTHKMPVHGPACSEIYSGREYFGPPVTDQATPQDWPSLASLVHRFRRSSIAGLPASVVLPWYTQFVGQDRRIAGQTGGRMGAQFDPFLVEGDATQHDFDVEGLQQLPGISPARLRDREQLYRHLQALSQNRLAQSNARALQERQYRQAFSLIEQGRLTEAFALDREPPSVRDGYGRTHFGQSLLLARRLVERGVELVTVNWNDEYKADKVSPHWDTHVDNFPKLKDRLCPPFDRAMAAFLDDLHQRGMLDSTLVVALGEFGRTPRIGAVSQNAMTESTGRDHWPHAFTALVAGGDLGGGTAYGRTTANGGYVDENPVYPCDLTATVLKHLLIDPHQHYKDHFTGQMQQLCEGRPLLSLG